MSLAEIYCNFWSKYCYGRIDSPLSNVYLIMDITGFDYTKARKVYRIIWGWFLSGYFPARIKVENNQWRLV